MGQNTQVVQVQSTNKSVRRRVDHRMNSSQNVIEIVLPSAVDVDNENPQDLAEVVPSLLQALPLRTHLALTAEFMNERANSLPNSVVGTLYGLGVRATGSELSVEQKRFLLEDLRGALRSSLNSQYLVSKLGG